MLFAWREGMTEVTMYTIFIPLSLTQVDSQHNLPPTRAAQETHLHDPSSAAYVPPRAHQDPAMVQPDSPLGTQTRPQVLLDNLPCCETFHRSLGNLP